LAGEEVIVKPTQTGSVLYYLVHVLYIPEGCDKRRLNRRLTVFVPTLSG